MAHLLAARLTAPLPSAIASIAVHGDQAIRTIAMILHCDSSENFWGIGRIRFLKWPILDGFEHVVICRVQENTVEIHCHGGVAVSGAILQSLEQAGCSIAQAQELHRVIALRDHADDGDWAKSIQFRCQQALVQCSSERAAGVLLDQASGALYTSLSRLEELLKAANWNEARKHLSSLTRWNELGQHLIEPWRVVLAGPPNVGKSSLINALSGQSVAIVHHEAGTTRDWIESSTMIDGWPVVLTDTAGIRETDEPIEREGVQRAQNLIVHADLVILVVDATIGWTNLHDQILQLCQQESQHGRRLLLAWNKIDLLPDATVLPDVKLLPDATVSPDIKHLPDTKLLSDTKLLPDATVLPEIKFLASRNKLSIPQVPDNIPIVGCSATGGIQGLVEAISTSLVPHPPQPGQAVLFEPKMRVLVDEIARRLASEVAPPIERELQLLAQQLSRI